MNRHAPQFTESDFQQALRCMATPEAFSLTGPEMRACQALLKHFRDGTPLPDEDMGIATRLLETLRPTRRRDGNERQGEQVTA